jgi:hypothetical protein
VLGVIWHAAAGSWLAVLAGIGLAGVLIEVVLMVRRIRSMNRRLRAMRRMAAAGTPELDPSDIDLRT